jgi:hypothetical protein
LPELSQILESENISSGMQKFPSEKSGTMSTPSLSGPFVGSPESTSSR